MSNQQPTQDSYYLDRSDEIDLTELIGHIWETRWRVFSAVVLALLLFVAYLAVNVLQQSEPVTYRHIFELNFDGLEDSQYPDGSPFVLSSVLSQTVLSRVHAQQRLGEYEMSVADLRRALFIEPYSPTFPLIEARYAQRMDNRDLDTAAIEALEQSMRSEMSLQNVGSVRISMQLPTDIPISEPQAEAVLKDIARIWAERAITEQGVLDLNRAIYSGEIFNPDRFADLDYPVVVDLLQENIELMRADITALQTRPHASNVADPETGLRLLDLDKILADMLEYDLRRIIDPVRELGLTRNAETAELYLTRQLRETQLEQRFWQERARLARQLVDGGIARPAGSESGEQSDSNNVALSAQIDSSFLDRLMEISRQGDSQAFRQSLMRQILEYEEQALTQEQAAGRIERSLAAIRGEGDGVTQAAFALYEKQLEQRLPQALQALQGHAATLQRISEQISLQASGNISELITPVGGSFTVAQAALIPPRAPVVLVAVVFLVGFAAMFISMVADAMRRRRNALEVTD